jgi:predicted Zn-dependent protease
VLRSGVFLHPDLDFHLRFPDGWRVTNTHQAVGAAPTTGGAALFLEIQEQGTDPIGAARTFVTRYADDLRLEILAAQPVKIGGLDAFRLDLNGVSGGMAVGAEVVFVAHRGLIYRISCVAPRATAKKYLALGRNAVRSFRSLKPEERASIQSLRLRVVTARPGDNLDTLSERTRNAWDAQRTAVLNGVYADVHFEGGELVKIARAEPYEPDAAPSPDSPLR